jgi:hypothetical protein
MLVSTLLRVFMNRETTDSYRLLFKRVFELVSEVQQTPTAFWYLHNRGIKAVVTDMCAKQMTGKNSPSRKNPN